MDGAFGGLIFAAVIIVIVVLLIQRSNRQRREDSYGRSSRGSYRMPSPGRSSARLSQPPAALGVPQGHPARQAAERLEYALTADFEARVKDRVLKNEPGMGERDWQWRWFELKRYFLMCGVLRNVPMYSAKVDDVWHEMLMFTWEYEQFCKNFCQSFIHHAPHAPGAKADPADRAWFDWVYGELFTILPASAQLWGAFYRTPLARERIEELELTQEQELRVRRFNTKAAEAYPDLNSTSAYLIERGRRLASDARNGAEKGASYEDPYRNNGMLNDPMMMTGVLSSALFFSSMGSADDFDRQMEEAQTEAQRQVNSGSGGSTAGCGGYGDNDHDSNGNDGSSCGGSGDSGGSDGGGSSCSSGSGDSGGGGGGCGGGCSS